MKYIVRSVKYFFYFSFLTTAIVLILVAIGAVEGNIEAIFNGGYDALWKIAVFFAVISAVYPSLAFIKRDIPTEGDFSSHRDIIIEYMKSHRYELEEDTPEAMSFRLKGIPARLIKMNEDKITFSAVLGGIQICGLRKDVIRFAAGLESRLLRQED